MGLNLGNTKIKDIYLGGTKIKEAYLGSSKVYSSLAPSTEWVNLGSTEYSRAGGSTAILWNNLTGMPSTSAYNYFTMIFDGYIASGSGGAADIFLGRSDGELWRMRAHFQYSYPIFVAVGSGNVTAWTTASGAPSIGTYSNLNNGRYCSSKFTKGSYVRFKIAFDRPNKRGYIYIGGTLLGYTTLNTDPINLKRFGLMSEQARSYEIAKMKNIKVAGFTTLAAAQAWS